MGYAQGQNTVSTANIIDSAVTTAKVNDDAVTLAKLAAGTDGELITWDASGDPAVVAVGDALQVLTSNGAGAAPSFQAAAGGTIVQLVEATHSTAHYTTSTSYVDTTFSGTITPTSASNKVLITTSFSAGASRITGGPNNHTGYFQLYRNAFASGVALQEHVVGDYDTAIGDGTYAGVLGFAYLDSPATTSAQIYSIGQKSTIVDMRCQFNQYGGRQCRMYLWEIAV
jgi:hypothetical protein